MGFLSRATAFINPATMISAGAGLVPSGIPVISSVATGIQKASDLSMRTAINLAKDNAGKYAGSQISQQLGNLPPEVQTFVNPMIERYVTPSDGIRNTPADESKPPENQIPDNLNVRESPDGFSRTNSFSPIVKAGNQQQQTDSSKYLIFGAIALLFLLKK